MHRRTALTAGVSLLTIAAGCTSDGDTQSSDPDGMDDGESESENGDEQELTLETFEYPESVDQDGFRRDLASVHEDRLAAAGSFQVVKTFERTETFTAEEEITITGDGDDLLLETGDEHLTTTAWTDSANDGTDVLVRNSNGDDERYMIGNRSQMVEDVDGSDTLGALIDAAMFEASELDERDGTSVVVFEAVDMVDVTALEGARSNSHMARYDELEASIVVSEAGVVGYRYELEGEGFDGPAVVTESATFDDVGETTLDEPDWVDEAEERALELSIEPAADGESFTVTVDQGEPIPAGARIGLSVGRYLEGRLDQEITGDDTLYLYDGGGELGVSVNSVPEPSSPLETRFAHLNIRTETGLVVYQGDYDSYAAE